MKTVLKNGIFAFLIIGIYFLIAELFGFSKKTGFRFLNFFILGFFVNKTILEAKKTDRTFVVQFTSSFITSILTVFLSTIALASYIHFWIGPDQIDSLSKPILNMGSMKLTLLQFSFAIFTEGIASGIILSFGLMQYWKNKKNKKKYIPSKI